MFVRLVPKIRYFLPLLTQNCHRRIRRSECLSHACSILCGLVGDTRKVTKRTANLGGVDPPYVAVVVVEEPILEWRNEPDGVLTKSRR
jgi:hypothetical protein